MALILSGDSTYAEQADVDSLSPQLATAWVNFDGTTGTIRDSYNISGVTRTGLGQYTITFETEMDNINYSVTSSGRNTNAGYISLAVMPFKASATTKEEPLIGSFKVHSGVQGVANDQDGDYIFLHVFGGKA